MLTISIGRHSAQIFVNETMSLNRIVTIVNSPKMEQEKRQMFIDYISDHYLDCCNGLITSLLLKQPFQLYKHSTAKVTTSTSLICFVGIWTIYAIFRLFLYMIFCKEKVILKRPDVNRPLDLNVLLTITAAKVPFYDRKVDLESVKTRT